MPISKSDDEEIESESCGLPVVASNIQGLRDAVIDGETGYLVEKGDVEGFAGRVTDMNLKKEQIRNTEHSTFDWAKIYKDCAAGQGRVF